MMYQQQQSFLNPPAYQPYQFQNPLQPQQNQNGSNVWDMKRALVVDGIEDAYRVQLPPGIISTIAYDIKKPQMYLIQITDGLNREVIAYDYVRHVEPQKSQSQMQTAQQDISHNQVSLNETLESINTRLAELEDKFNGSVKPDSTGNKPKYNKSGNGSNAGSH